MKKETKEHGSTTYYFKIKAPISENKLTYLLSGIDPNRNRVEHQLDSTTFRMVKDTRF